MDPLLGGVDGVWMQASSQQQLKIPGRALSNSPDLAGPGVFLLKSRQFNLQRGTGQAQEAGDPCSKVLSNTGFSRGKTARI